MKLRFISEDLIRNNIKNDILLDSTVKLNFWDGTDFLDEIKNQTNDIHLTLPINIKSNFW
jgi:hypothetical protein